MSPNTSIVARSSEWYSGSILKIMRLVFAVAEDLYTFAVESVVNFFITQRTYDPGTRWELEKEFSEEPSNNIEFEDEVLVPEEKDMENTQPTFRSTSEILDVEEQYPTKNTVMYVGSTEAPLFKNPTIEFDGVIGRIPYGSMVMALEQRGRWTKIVIDGRDGWMLRDDLSDRSAHVYPHFVIGEHNEYEDPNTIRLRTIVSDEFAAGDAELPLQSSEYVYYRLYRKGLRIAWPDIHPRNEGTWHTILKGAMGIHIGIRPKTGSIMEYELQSGLGHIAYVEAVFPDETINISETNYPDRGIYNERVLTREEWKELRPVFIQVT